MGLSASKLPGCSTSRRRGPEVTPGMYAVDLSRLESPQLATTFVPSQRDGITDSFLAAAAHDGCDAAKLAAAKRDRERFLGAQRRGWSRTDASAVYLNMTLLVASPDQLRRVFVPAMAAAPSSTLLDIGAGRGEATASIASALGVRDRDVTVMEAAAQIRLLATERGYKAVASFEELGPGQTFGAVVMLNVLDRCDDPRGLLRAAVNALRPDGLLLIATVLPFCPLVYEGVAGKVGAHRAPAHPLKLPRSLRCGAAKSKGFLGKGLFEQHLAGFVAATVGTLPLRVASWPQHRQNCPRS